MPAIMSCGPAIVAIRRRSRASRCSTARCAPSSLATSTYGRLARVSGRPLHTTGRPSRDSVAGSGSAPCMDATMTPSTWPLAAYRSTRSWLGPESHIISTSCLLAASSSWLTPLMMLAKYGSSEKTRLADLGVPLDAVVAGAGVAHHQHELLVGRVELLAHAPDDAGEVRVVGEDAAGRLRQHQCYRVCPLGYQAAGGQVRDVPEVGHRSQDGLADVRRDARRAVDDPRGGRSRDAGAHRDALQRRSLPPRRPHAHRFLLLIRAGPSSRRLESILHATWPRRPCRSWSRARRLDRRAFPTRATNVLPVPS